MKQPFVLLLIALSIHGNAQVFFSKNDVKKNEADIQKNLDSKLFEVKAFKYVYINGKMSDNGELAEYKKYNPQGFIVEQYTSINPDFTTDMAAKSIYTYENNRLSSLYMESKIGDFEVKSKEEYTYTNGNLVKGVMTGPNFVATNEYEYDENRNLTKQNYGVGNSSFKIKYTYDANGNKNSMKVSDATTTYSYDDRNNLVFVDQKNINGQCQSSYVYDSLNNCIEFERIQVSSSAGDEWNRAQYKHCLFSYKRGRLNIRVDKAPEGDTISIIKYEYTFNGNYAKVAEELVGDKMGEWLKKGRYESTQDYQQRILDASKAKQMEIFRKESINELGKKRYSFKPLRMDYDADKELFSITFDELPPVIVAVPKTEAEGFEKNKANLLFEPQFLLEQDNLILTACAVKNPSNNKEYLSK
jgi:hypothetical protein